MGKERTIYFSEAKTNITDLLKANYRNEVLIVIEKNYMKRYWVSGLLRQEDEDMKVKRIWEEERV